MPRNLVLGVAACVFAAEVAIMGLLCLLPELSPGVRPFLDAGALLLLLAPALHFLVVRPMAREIARRARAEERWRQSEERFRRAFEDAPIGMALVGTDDRYLQVNRALCEILGYAPEHLLGLTVPEVTHPEDLSAEQSLKSHVRSGAAHGFQLEKRYLHRDGHVVWGQLSVSSVTAPGGQPLYAIQQLEDITERKQAERELREARDQLEDRVRQRTAELEEINLALLREVERRRRAQDALRESERKYSTLVESSLTGIFIHQDGKVAFVNRTGAELPGYRVAEMEGAVVNGLLVAKEVSFELAKPVEIEAVVEAVGASSVTVTGVTIQVDNSTILGDKTPASVSPFNVSSLAIGDRVDVRAFIDDDGAAVAARLEPEDAHTDNRVILQGPASGATDNVVTVLGATVDTTGISEASPSRFNDVTGADITRAQFLTLALQPGNLVKFRGTLSGGVITWERAEIEVEHDFANDGSNEFEFEFENEVDLTPG